MHSDYKTDSKQCQELKILKAFKDIADQQILAITGSCPLSEMYETAVWFKIRKAVVDGITVLEMLTAFAPEGD